MLFFPIQPTRVLEKGKAPMRILSIFLTGRESFFLRLQPAQEIGVERTCLSELDDLIDLFG